ncbi:lysine N(6)-hydroxylase/L-ornithine N(5)-oxygenase family protein [Streptomyces sp. NBC_00459]|uniref:lysine N(6)-hydroxylase/L-ornithine N(5)-oxygenase family protein n=1 Tax=Streptomyces sp. NBC_00459 TaxID=2975749 RepID=UPI002E1715EB
MSETYDVLGVGFGPANLALAIALEETAPDLTMRFLDARANPLWQAGMLLDRSDIQNHPSRDLVTLRNPRSRYSFLNYLHESARLVEHLNVPAAFPLRKEYAKYISWVTQQFGHVAGLGEQVTSVSLVGTGPDRRYRVASQLGEEYHGRTLILGTGRTPYIPEPFAGELSPRIFHASDYLFALDRLTGQGEPRRVAVIGGSQSAVEISLDLAGRFSETEVVTYLRSPSFRLKDTSPFSEEVFFPDFTQYFYNSSAEARKYLNEYLYLTNYSSTDADVLHELYRLIYEQRLDGRQRVHVLGNRAVDAVASDEDSVTLTVREVHQGQSVAETFDFVVVATGFKNLGRGPAREPYPSLLHDLADRFVYDDQGSVFVQEDYSLAFTDPDEPPLYLNGLCESSHGMGDAGSFSLLSVRATTLAESLRKRSAEWRTETAHAPAH